MAEKAYSIGPIYGMKWTKDLKCHDISLEAYIFAWPISSVIPVSKDAHVLECRIPQC
jgi:hypothetical protein